jgi:glyoxylase-like metal-dependent hydrolase (beta-lactamase superfamily II)
MLSDKAFEQKCLHLDRSIRASCAGVEGDSELLPGLELIETSGHVLGHQSVLARLLKKGDCNRTTAGTG